ncbi:MAG TPA: c-type cytochrome [Blastocatellia bacterium]|nr:c-type cytochrome [Blastocatellia bacterium]
MKAFRLSIVLMLAALSGAACGTHEAPGAHGTTANQNAAAATTANANTAASSPAAASAPSGGDGAALYQSIGCAVCHGADGKGNAQMKDIPNFTDAAWQKKATDAEIIGVIQNGKPPMPPYKSRLTDEQIKSLVTYVRSLAK